MTDLWGGRFSEPLDEKMRRFSSSYAVDSRLAKYDVVGSKAHAHALHSAGVLDVLAELADAGKAVVMVTHDEQARKRGSRLVKLEDGKVV